MREEFLRTASLIGTDGLEKLNKSTVAVFGLGGVGSYTAEALCRSGVGKLHLFDNDTVAASNINRQLIATRQTVGRLKTSVAHERCISINPDVNVIEHPIFIRPDMEIDFSEFDYAVDAVDNITAKLFLIESAQKAGVPLISVMGTGNKINPSLLTVTDIYKTYECPLARVIRMELKKRGIKHQKVVWSPEKPAVPVDFGERRQTGRVCPGSMAMVPGTAGLIAAAEAIKTLLQMAPR